MAYPLKLMYDAPPPILLPCSICSRTFKPESLSKHRKACEKLSSKKRKIFDSSKQRIQGTELAEYLPVILHSKKPEKVVVKKDTPSWKEKHLEFVRAIRAARGLEDGSNAKTSSGTMFRPSNHERCPHCDRHFGPKAFDRHIEWCKEQKARIPKSPASNQAKERLEARTKYRAPPLAKSKRSLTREKYAPPSHHSSQDLCPPTTRNQHQLPSVTAMPVIKGTKPQGGGNNTRASVSSPPLQRGTTQRASVRQRSASPTKRIIGSTTRSIPGKPTTLKAKQESLETKGTKLSALCNVSKIRPSAPVTKAAKLSSQLNSGSEEPYDPYASAERQMMELLSHGDCQPNPKTPTRPTVHSAPASAGLETSSQSAFARYTQSEDLTSSLIENLQDLIISGHSASTLSLCENNNFSGNIPDVLSSLGFNFVNNNLEERERTRKPSKIRAKMENASLSLQKSVCMLNYENNQTKLGVEIDDFNHISDDQDNFSSPVLSKTVPSPFSSPDSKCTLPYSTCQMEEGDGVERKHSEYEEQCSSNSRRSAGSKFSADSAYSSLNRRSPHASTVHQAVEGAEMSGLLDSERGRGRLLSSSSSESSLPPLCTVQVLKTEDKTPSLTPTPPPIMQTSPVESKLPRFCHECGSKYPVSVAKFCCQCGARRLVM
ncbi:uncharacterized protein [Anabrus simplex]|uniref:uncharacterized protein n=1 Tax=Anabrus simplex TaxID=316456 RepID=UPI0035A2ABDD